MLYIFTFIIALLCFGAVASDSVIIGGAVGAVHKNAPHIVTTYSAVFSVLGLLFAVAFFNNAALRDYQHQFDEIIFTTPISKAAYFFGRFFGAWFLASFPFIGIYLGMTIGTWLAPIFDWVPPERFGPIPWSTYGSAYLILILPNMLFSGSLIFGLAQKWRNTIVSFVGALLLMIAYIISGSFLSDLDNVDLAALSDPFGIRTYSVDSRYTTTSEKNEQGIAFTARVVQNRLIWLGVGSGILFLSFWAFSPQKNPSRRKSRRSQRKLGKHSKERASEAEAVITQRPSVLQNFEGNFWIHFSSFFRDAYTSIIRSTVFRILLAFAVILLVTDLVSGYEYFGLKSYPLTYKMVDTISGSSGLFLIIILVFFSGELVWRSRMAHIDEVISATPHQSFAQLLAQLCSLVAAGSILYFTFVIAAILAQIFQGFTFIEWGLYFGEFFYNQLPTFIIFGALNLFIQVWVNQRYLGYFVSILIFFILDFIWAVLDIQTNMLAIGDGPSIAYTDLNAYGPGFNGAMWFNAYWLSFSLVLLFIAGPFVYRLKISGWKSRWAQARQVFRGSYRAMTFLALAIFTAIGAWVYYNTQVLNTYRTSDEVEELLADYEKKYRHYADYPMPKIDAISYAIDLYPEERKVELHAEMTLKNTGPVAIDSLFFTLDDNWQTEINGPMTEAWFDEKFGFKAYALQKPLEPGQSIDLSIDNLLEHQGFENSRGSTSIIANGSFLNNGAVLPDLGYNKNAELSDRNTRKKYDLKPKKRMPDLERDSCTDACMVNYLSDGLSDWVAVETVISTSMDQIAIAPGRLVKEWTEGERRYFRYSVDQASQNFYAFISGDYQKAHRKWKGIDLEVYYDAKHDYNVEGMLDAIQRSLEYYTENFGPYYHQQARIIEFPRYATFAQAFPGTMPYSEGFGFITNLEDEEGNNVIDAVIAHEMAHQWWAHQEIPALMQGGTFLTESFSEYSSLMVMKQESDPVKMGEFLKYDLDRYLRGRSSEVEKELPLLEVENQGYIHYGKGSVILYALQEMIGEDSVNAALSSFLKEYRYKEPPYPNSLDFMRHLEPKVPDSLQYLLEDWIRKITLYDFRLMAVKQEESAEGFELDLEIEAYKYYADTLGQQQSISPNEWVEIAFYADDDQENLIQSKQVRLNAAQMKMKFTLPEEIARVVIDPRRVYIERDVKDNAKGL